MAAVAAGCFSRLGVGKAKEFALLSLNMFQVLLCPDTDVTGFCVFVRPGLQFPCYQGAGGCFGMGRYCHPAAEVFGFPGLQQR